jgi:hypothetical protein
LPAPANVLDIESTVFTRYLAGETPSDYVRRKYRDGHRAIPYRTRQDEDALDVALTVVARRGPVRARIADAYARVFRPHGVLRQKLTLLLAILENSPETHRRFTSGGRGRLAAVFSIGGSLLLFGFSLLAGLFFFGPVHRLLRGRRPVAKVPA